MRADSVIRWFMPKEEGFRELLSRDSQNLVKGARLFAEMFHRAYAEQGSALEALHQAQLAALRSEDRTLRSPVTWAAFQLIGGAT